jgi:formylglycine-generating enzyme required for sulfatase activity
MAFCRWLSEKTGRKFSLPSEAQWEYACRAGTATPFYFGGLDGDFSKFANLADTKLSEFASNPYTVFEPLKNPSQYDDYIPKDTRFNDGGLVSVKVDSFLPNAWGLHDMHGNVCEWTRTTYAPYPYREDDGRNDLSEDRKKVVRGGSWRDLPKRATSAFRLNYRAWQPVYNVGFRVVCDAE